MIHTGIKLKNIIDFLKQNLSVLVVIPAFIGGLWQSIELMSISTQYIRFFSISQIVPDGILILMFLIIAFSYQLVGWYGDVLFFFNRKAKPVEFLNSEDYEIFRRKEMNYWVAYFISSYVFSILYVYYLVDNKYILTQFESFIVSSFFIVFILNRALRNCYYFSKDIHKKYFKGCNILLFFLYVVLAINIGKHVHKSFITPSNILNFEQVKCIVADKYPNAKQEMLYFNDKYIFVKIIDRVKSDRIGKVLKPNTEKVYIVKFENLFKEID